MIRIAISVEGPTEREFVDSILAPYFRQHNKFIQGITICTKTECNGKKHTGGYVTIPRVKDELQKLLPSYDYVTTFYDFYGFNQTTSTNADDLEQEIGNIFNSRKLIPYIQKYEFETLVFASPELIGQEVGDDNAKNDAQTIVDTFGGVIENINNSPLTAPSKRIMEIFDRYGECYVKTYHGPYIIDELGIDYVRSKCPRFNNWIEKLLAL